MIETLEAQKYIRNQHLLSLIDYKVAGGSWTTEARDLYKIFTFYCHEDHSLAQEIQSRAARSLSFSPDEIWGIMSSVALGLACLQK